MHKHEGVELKDAPVSFPELSDVGACELTEHHIWKKVTLLMVTVVEVF